MVKCGLEFFILKFTEPLQSCCCPVQKNLPRKAALAWQVNRYLWRGSWNFKIFFSRPLSWMKLTAGRHPIISTALITFLSRVAGLTLAFLCFVFTIFCVCTNIITPTFRLGFSSRDPIQFETFKWINIIYAILMKFRKMKTMRRNLPELSIVLIFQINLLNSSLNNISQTVKKLFFVYFY